MRIGKRGAKFILNLIRKIIGSKRHHGILSSLGGSHSIPDFIALINNSEKSNYGSIFNSFGIEPHHKVLDIGFGAGQFLFMASEVSEHVVGIEPHDELFDYVNSEIAKKGISNVEIVKSVGEELAFETSSFDKVLLMSVLMLVRPKAMLLEINRVLKPEHEVVLHLSNYGYALNCIRDGVYCDDKSRIDVGLSFIVTRLKRVLTRDYNVGGVFTRKDIEALAHKTGFEVVRYESAPYFNWEPDNFWGFERQFLVILRKLKS